MIPFDRSVKGQVAPRFNLTELTWYFPVKKIHDPFVSAKLNVVAALA